MKKIRLFLILFTSVIGWSQSDYTNNWEDFYSYNNVKDFVKEGNIIYNVVDNAVFTYDVVSGEIQKMSSVHGLSGETATSINYSQEFKRLVIGYETGLIEVVDSNGEITIAKDIVNFNLIGEKQINHIAKHQNKLYLSTPFAVVVYDIEKLQFGDTFFIGNQSSSIKINQTAILDDVIYAATETGVFTADITSSNLIDFNQWTQHFTGNFKSIKVFNGKVFTSRDNNLYAIIDENTLQIQSTLSSEILEISSSQEYLTAVMKTKAIAFDSLMNEIASVTANELYDFDLNTAYAENSTWYLGTKKTGLLKRHFLNTETFEEIHPEGPTSNDVFSITVKNNHLWVVYGGIRFDAGWDHKGNKKGISHFNGEAWNNIPFNSFGVEDLVHVTVDPASENSVYVSSWGATGNPNSKATGGMLVIENDSDFTFFNQLNSGLESLVLSGSPNYTSIRVNGSAFDNQGNLWIANSWVDERLKKYAANGTWSSFDLSSLITNQALGLTELRVDKTNSIWIGSRRNGALVFNETGNRKRVLTTEATKGALPDLNVRTIAVDKNNRIWLGTLKGLRVYNNTSNLFDTSIYDAEPVIILDDGIPKKLLGDQSINTILVDGADNKWFGTDMGGVLYTSPNGQKTLQNFNKENSPLPSNRILKIQIDESTGKVYFATDKGIVAFKSNVVPFGEKLKEVYAYPNPVLKQHDFVTIDGRNGTHIPKGTNVKIIDVAGNLVYETNVVEGQELHGGKVVWDKTNLSGRKVASGVYIVLLTIRDNSETSTTKIAIVN